jgi:hypothetical protein
MFGCPHGRSFANQAPTKESHLIHPTQELPGSALREQAKLLGLCPSTSHAVLQRNYKNSGLSAAIIKRMLACPNLPERARTIILEYNAEKIAGLYGHTRSQRRRFMAALATEALITITVDRDPLTEASGLVQKDSSPNKQQASAI